MRITYCLLFCFTLMWDVILFTWCGIKQTTQATDSQWKHVAFSTLWHTTLNFVSPTRPPKCISAHFAVVHQRSLSNISVSAEHLLEVLHCNCFHILLLMYLLKFQEVKVSIFLNSLSLRLLTQDIYSSWKDDVDNDGRRPRPKVQPSLESHFLPRLHPSTVIHFRRPSPRCHGQPPGADPGAAAAGQGAQPGEAAGSPEAPHPAAEEMGCVREGDAKQEAKGGQEESQCQQPPAGVQEACVVRCQRGTSGGVGQEWSGWR